MITLYRVAECKACDEVQATLRDLVVAHQVFDIEKLPVQAGGERLQPVVVDAADVPLIVDGERQVSGQSALQEYLEELAKEMEQWRKFQVDACYIDGDGKVC